MVNREIRLNIWSGYHSDRKIPIIINVEYDDELDLYIVEVLRGTERDFKTFSPKHEPKDGLMHISDVEKSVKLANILIKELKQEAQRRK